MSMREKGRGATKRDLKKSENGIAYVVKTHDYCVRFQI